MSAANNRNLPDDTAPGPEVVGQTPELPLPRRNRNCHGPHRRGDPDRRIALRRVDR